MSTELVAIEKIEIRHGDKNADEIRMELVKYLRQFLDSASIESMTLHDLAISINGEMIQISVYSKMFLENSDCGCVKVKYVKKDHPTKERWSFSYV